MLMNMCCGVMCTATSEKERRIERCQQRSQSIVFHPSRKGITAVFLTSALLENVVVVLVFPSIIYIIKSFLLVVLGKAFDTNQRKEVQV